MLFLKNTIVRDIFPLPSFPHVAGHQEALPDCPLPQYTVLQCRCYMGLFPEIERAWITVDHRLFLWDYEDGLVHGHGQYGSLKAD